MSRGPQPQSAIAIVSDKQLGDVVLLEPMTRLLAGQSAGPCALYVKEAFRPLVELMPKAVWGPDLKSNYQTLWTTSWGSRAARRALRIRATRKILQANSPTHLRWWHRLIYDQRRVTPIAEYWGSYFWRVAGGDPERFSPPRLISPPESWRPAALPEGSYGLANPTAAWPSKLWSPDKWATILDHPSSLPWVMTGGGSDFELEHSAQIASRTKTSFSNLSGKTSLKEYIYIISRAAFVLCVDGSSAHLAQAFGVPCITLFGPVEEQRWHWPCRANRILCARHFTEQASPKMDDLPVKPVLEELQRLENDLFKGRK